MIIRHRINTIEGLRKVPSQYGVEIDIRGYGDKMLLNHDPIDKPSKYDGLEDYLREFHHAFIIFNVKEAGYESRIIDLANKHNIGNYFLLDVEFPYIYRATRKEGVRKIAVRYSEAEPIEMVEAQIKDAKPLLDWVWIDTNTVLPLTHDIVNRLKPFKTCLVCPERWGRPQDIPRYIEYIKELGFKLDAVMTDEKFVPLWENSGIVK
ncbi:hypothetical protein KW787_01265 [Candidatus Pacearchaeota archaeon]|nr:hypothetical protein [Candidatus Pacearchaeota archaeon]